MSTQPSSFQVEGVHCNSCVKRIQKAIGVLPGVTQVDVNIEANTVQVQHDSSQTNSDIIAQALTKAGYPVR